MWGKTSSLFLHLLFLFENSKHDICKNWSKDKLETNDFHDVLSEKNRENDEKVMKLMKWLSITQGIKVMGGKGCKSNQSNEMILIFQKSWKSCSEKDIELMKVIEWFSFFPIMKIMKGKWCKSNETNEIILNFSNYQRHAMKMM